MTNINKLLRLDFKFLKQYYKMYTFIALFMLFVLEIWHLIWEF